VASIQQAVRSGETASAGEWLAHVRANEQQLLQARPKDYAVQLLAMDREGVTGFVNKHGLAGKVVYFRTRVNGQERYAALMGGYADRDQALAAGHRIAAETRGIHPWVRSLASVQEVIRNYDDHPR
jgi:septal ring-binding cell division protein DamX